MVCFQRVARIFCLGWPPRRFPKGSAWGTTPAGTPVRLPDVHFEYKMNRIPGGTAARAQKELQTPFFNTKPIGFWTRAHQAPFPRATPLAAAPRAHQAPFPGATPPAAAPRPPKKTDQSPVLFYGCKKYCSVFPKTGPKTTGETMRDPCSVFRLQKKCCPIPASRPRPASRQPDKKCENPVLFLGFKKYGSVSSSPRPALG